MFFHVDESGNTGNNFFDTDQPRLSYGVISSTLNADALCIASHKKVQDIVGEQLIHANKLGIGGLAKISHLLIEIQTKLRLDFDYYFIQKPDFALVLFFDAVFDAGLNKAVKWDAYWTPLRYVLIHKLSLLFDESLLRESLRLCMEKNIERYKVDIVEMLSTLKARLGMAGLDARSVEIIKDALDFGISNPLGLDFGNKDNKMISPNAIGFQFVVSSIARRVRNKGRKKATSIIVDRQNQFNSAQIGTHFHLAKIAAGLKNFSPKERDRYLRHPLYSTIDKADITQEGLQGSELTISKSADSIGLQIVDVYLWIANKVLSGQDLPGELKCLWSMFSRRSSIDGISLEFMARRFSNFERLLPQLDDLTDKQRCLAEESVQDHRRKVQNFRAGEADAETGC